MIGERGGTVHSLDQAVALMEQHKPNWTAKIRCRIAEVLLDRGTFHAQDLADLNVPADCKNIIGAAVMAAVKKRYMRETGERRSCASAQGHGRRSAVYEVTAYGRSVLADKLAETAVETESDKAVKSSVGVHTGPPTEPLQLGLIAEDSTPDPKRNRFVDLDQRAA